MHKQSLLLAFLAASGLCLWTCGGGSPKKTTPATAVASSAGDTTVVLAEITWLERDHHFGEILEGTQVRHSYGFVNSGDIPLVISYAQGNCGCTVPKWPKKPIAVGDSAEIVVNFDSKSRTGTQTKRINITANTDPSISVLTLRGEVKKAKK